MHSNRFLTTAVGAMLLAVPCAVLSQDGSCWPNNWPITASNATCFSSPNGICQTNTYQITWSDNYVSYVSASGVGAQSAIFYYQCDIQSCEGLNAEPPVQCPPDFSNIVVSEGDEGSPGSWSITVQNYTAFTTTQPCGGLCANTYNTGGSCIEAPPSFYNSVHTCGVSDCGTGCDNDDNNCPGGLECLPGPCTGSCGCSDQCDDPVCCVAPSCDWCSDCS